jgi:hypothetical protein
MDGPGENGINSIVKIGLKDIGNGKMKNTKCKCERSPTGLCVGWHSLTEEKYEERKKQYEELDEEKKQTYFHPRAIDGFGD